MENKKSNKFKDIIYEILETENMCPKCNIPMIAKLPTEEGIGDFAVLSGFICQKCELFIINFGDRNVARRKS